MQSAMEDRRETQETLKKDETGSLISADKVQGTDIYNRRGDNLGEVESVMIDKRSGKVAYAVVTFGGFLGIGSERRALPWNVLSYNTDLGGYVVDAEDDVLRRTPVYADNNNIDPEWGKRLHGHFGVPPYWQ
ncbi:PRC-barrel domain-containing protein [Dongia sp.]|uniref:PRC-barrel domain-containing protein n=1 Tax=Dongia sp. TaxID=1977262 RepID=UPI0035B05CE0